jgi:hypothetical protein
MKYRLIGAEKAQHPVSLLCEVLGVSRSGFHAWLVRQPSKRWLSDVRLAELIHQVHAESDGTYGSPRVHAELRHRGVRVGRKRVERLMRRHSLSGLAKRRRGKTTVRVPGVRPAPDLVGRDFRPSGPNRLWVADLTEFRPGRASSTWPWCSTASAGGWSAGRWRSTCAQSSSSRRSRWPSAAASPRRGSSTTPTRARGPNSTGRRNRGPWDQPIDPGGGGVGACAAAPPAG